MASFFLCLVCQQSALLCTDSSCPRHVDIYTPDGMRPGLWPHRMKEKERKRERERAKAQEKHKGLKRPSYTKMPRAQRTIRIWLVYEFTSILVPHGCSCSVISRIEMHACWAHVVHSDLMWQIFVLLCNGGIRSPHADSQSLRLLLKDVSLRLEPGECLANDWCW